MPQPVTSHRCVRTRWTVRTALGLAVSTVAVSTAVLAAAPGIAAAAPLPPLAPSPMEQGTQLLQTINGAVAEASTDPTITLVTCLLTEAQTQIVRFATGSFNLVGAVDGFASCFTAFAAGGAPDAIIPSPDVGDHTTQLPPGQTTTAKFVAPAAGTFTSGFGTRWGATHYGIDIANSIGTPIVSVAPGTVISAGPASGFGLWVRVRHDDGTITVYGHNDSNAVTVGQRVRTNQVIAYIGNRGDSTGPHVHFEVTLPNGTRVDPAAWLRQRGVTV